MPKSESRLYVVSTVGANPDAPGSERLVDASHPTAAIKHVAPQYSAKIATQRDVARLMRAGVKIETAGDAPEAA